MPFAEDQPRIDHSRITPIVPNSWPQCADRIGVSVGFTVPALASEFGRSLAEDRALTCYRGVQYLGPGVLEADGSLPERERRAIVREFTDPDLVAEYGEVLVDLGFDHRGVRDAETGELLLVIVDYDCGLAIKAFIAVVCVALQNMINAGSDETTFRVESPWSECRRMLPAVLAAASLRLVSQRDAENGGIVVTISRV